MGSFPAVMSYPLPPNPPQRCPSLPCPQLRPALLKKAGSSSRALTSVSLLSHLRCSLLPMGLLNIKALGRNHQWIWPRSFHCCLFLRNGTALKWRWVLVGMKEGKAPSRRAAGGTEWGGGSSTQWHRGCSEPGLRKGDSLSSPAPGCTVRSCLPLPLCLSFSWTCREQMWWWWWCCWSWWWYNPCEAAHGNGTGSCCAVSTALWLVSSQPGQQMASPFWASGSSL